MKVVFVASAVATLAAIVAAAPAYEERTTNAFIDGDPYVVVVQDYVTTTTTTVSTPVATETTTSTTETALIRIPDPKIVSDLKKQFSALAQLKSADKSLIQDIISKLDPLHILSRLDPTHILSKLDPLNLLDNLLKSDGTPKHSGEFDLPAYLQEAAEQAAASLKVFEGASLHNNNINVNGISDDQEALGISLLGEKEFAELVNKQGASSKQNKPAQHAKAKQQH